MKLKSGILTIISSVCALGVSGQIGARFDQYFADPSLVNPAAINLTATGSLNLFYNRMYSSIPGSPQNMALNVALPVSGKRVGMGGYLLQEKSGFSTLQNAYASYAYSIPVGNEGGLHFGVSLGYLQQRFDMNAAIYKDQNDPVVQTLINTLPTRRADIRGSALYANDKLTVGISASRLLTPRFNYQYIQTKANYQLQQLSNLIAMYKIEVGDELALQPGVLVTFYDFKSTRIQGNLNAWFRDYLWLGVSTNNGTELGFNAGGILQEGIRVGYSYSFPLQKNNSLLGAVHEFHTAFILGAMGGGKAADGRSASSFQGDDEEDEKPVRRIQGTATVKKLSDFTKIGLNVDTAQIKLPSLAEAAPEPAFYVSTGIFSTEANADRAIKENYTRDVYSYKIFLPASKHYLVYVYKTKTKDDADNFKFNNNLDVKEVWVKKVE